MTKRAVLVFFVLLICIVSYWAYLIVNRDDYFSVKNGLQAEIINLSVKNSEYRDDVIGDVKKQVDDYYNILNSLKSEKKYSDISKLSNEERLGLIDFILLGEREEYYHILRNEELYASQFDSEIDPRFTAIFYDQKEALTIINSVYQDKFFARSSISVLDVAIYYCASQVINKLVDELWPIGTDYWDSDYTYYRYVKSVCPQHLHQIDEKYSLTKSIDDYLFLPVRSYRDWIVKNANRKFFIACVSTIFLVLLLLAKKLKNT